MTEAVEWELTGLTRSSCVVQQGRPVLVRGRAKAGEAVRVTLGGQSVAATADDAGRWQCHLPALEVGGPYEGQVEATGRETIHLTDIWAGEVWLCAGQSNMAMALSALEAEEQPAPAEVGMQPQVRMAHIMPKVAAEPEADVKARWLEAAAWPRITSGAGYHFARLLASKLNRPVGIVQAAVGHTPAMSWTSRRAIAPGSTAAKKLTAFDQELELHPQARGDLESWRQKDSTQNNKWNKAVSAWLPIARAAHDAGLPYDPMPAFPQNLGNTHTPTVLYNAMIAPLAGEAVAGVFWYQGESDAILGFAREYDRSLAGLKAGFSQLFGPVPLVVVELPGHLDIQCDDPDESWPRVRWAQQRSLADEQVAVVPTIDLGDRNMIHPTRKKTLAQRAAAVAMTVAYPTMVNGDEARRHGPVLDVARFEQDRIVLTIKGVKGRLSHQPSQAKNAAKFEVHVEDSWQQASFDVTGPAELTIRLTAGQQHARAVRHAWQGDPRVEIYDEGYWPLSPFEAWRGETTQGNQS